MRLPEPDALHLSDVVTDRATRVGAHAQEERVDLGRAQRSPHPRPQPRVERWSEVDGRGDASTSLAWTWGSGVRGQKYAITVIVNCIVSPTPELPEHGMYRKVVSGSVVPGAKPGWSGLAVEDDSARLSWA